MVYKPRSFNGHSATFCACLNITGNNMLDIFINFQSIIKAKNILESLTPFQQVRINKIGRLISLGLIWIWKYILFPGGGDASKLTV